MPGRFNFPPTPTAKSNYSSTKPSTESTYNFPRASAAASAAAALVPHYAPPVKHSYSVPPMFYLYYCFFILYGLIVGTQDCITFLKHGPMHLVVALGSIFRAFLSLFRSVRGGVNSETTNLVSYFGHSFCFGALFCYFFLGIAL